MALLGCILFDNHAFRRVEDVVEPEDFHQPLHGRLYETVAELLRKGMLADPIVVARRFEADEALNTLGGSTYLLNLTDHAPPSSNAAAYAEEIAETASRRRLIQAARELEKDAFDQAAGRSATEVIVGGEKALAELASRGTTKAEFHSLGDVYVRQIARSRAAAGMPPGVPTGIAELDAVLGGLRPSTTNIFAGRPGMGKSAAGVVIAKNVAQPCEAAPKGRGVAFFSLEMPEEQLAVRFGCSLVYDREAPVYSGSSSNPTYEQFERGELTDAQWDKLEEGRHLLTQLPIDLDFRPKLRVSQMAAATRRRKQEWRRRGIKPGLVVIDHILHVAGVDPRLTNPVEKFTQISGDVLEMAKSLEMPVVVLCQLSRGVEGREDKRPQLSDLKFTGALEEDAFSATFLYRPSYYNRPPEGEDQDKAWAKYQSIKSKYDQKLLFLIEKNRGGRGQQQVETFCDIGCNAIESMSFAPVQAPIHFAEDDGFGRV